MRVFAWCIAAMLVLPMSVHETGTAAQARIDVDDRPFVEHLDWQDAQQAVRRALRGDREARASIDQGRIAYVPLILAPENGRDGTFWGHELLRAELSWVRSMQGWEVVLAKHDSAAVEKAYRERQGLFRESMPQLARAILHAAEQGNRAVLSRLVAIAPEEPWVKAALAYAGETAGQAERINAMVAILPELAYSSRYRLRLKFALLDDEGRRLRYPGPEYRDREADLVVLPEGIEILEPLPAEWGAYGFHERLGALAHTLPSEDARKELFEKVQHLSSEMAGAINFVSSFALMAWPDNPPRSVYPVSGMRSGISRAGMLYNMAVHRYEGLRSATLAAGIPMLHGEPEWQPGQRLLLKSALSSGEAVYARMVARSILALRDDWSDSVSSLAAELPQSDLLMAEAEKFRALLAAADSPFLKSLAEGMGRQSDPAMLYPQRLGLDEAQRASLMAAFVHEDEVNAYGSAAATLLGTIALHRIGRNQVTIALELAQSAAAESAAAHERAGGLAFAAQFLHALDLAVGEDEAQRLLSALPQSPGAIVLRNEDALRRGQVPDALDESDRVYHRVAEVLEVRDANPAKEDIARLETELSYGGGHGLLLCGLAHVRHGDRARRNQLYARVYETAPTDARLHAHLASNFSRFARNPWNDWATVERAVLCRALVQPFAIETAGGLASLFARSSCPPRPIQSLIRQAYERPTHPFAGNETVRRFKRMQFDRYAVGVFLSRNFAAFGVPREWQSACADAYITASWGTEMESNLRSVTNATRGSVYLLTCVDGELQNRGRDSVDRLLNIALEIPRQAPEYAISLVEESQKIGVSRYGYFVGTQPWIRAKSRLGEVDAAMKRYLEMRDGSVGLPHVLDRHLLMGLLEGNQWEALPRALKEIESRRPNITGTSMPFAYRRALMAVGRHGDVRRAPLPAAAENTAEAYNMTPWSPLFHEARALLDAKQFKTLSERASAYLSSSVEDSVGTYLDAALLAGVAARMQKLEVHDRTAGRLRVLSPEAAHVFLPSDGMLDLQAWKILAGDIAPTELPGAGEQWFWHGQRYYERPCVSGGHGFVGIDECEARDHFVRGVIFWLAGNNASARTELRACVRANQRCSHEYHVAEWLLANGFGR